MKLKAESNIAWHYNWDRIDNTEDPNWFVKFLDSTRLRQLENIREDPAEYFSHLEIRPNLHVLDLGCGTGILLHPLAELVGINGRIVGVDISEFMVKEARKRAQTTDLPLEFYKGNVYSLDFPENSFDRATCSTLFQHLKRPDEALNEIKRVVKPGGLISVFDHDWDTLFINSSFPTITRKIFEYFRNSLKNGDVGSRLRPIFESAGLSIIRSYNVKLSLQYDEFLNSNIGFYQASQLCVEESIISSGERQLWLNDLADKAQIGEFRFEFTGYRVIGIK